MWDAFAKILTNSNALLVLVFVSVFILILIILVQAGMVRIDTGAFKMGADNKERDIIRQQIEWSHSYIIGLKSQILADESKYNGYLTLFMLEAAHNEVSNWITFNHINLESDYISIKQEKIRSMIHSEPTISHEFKTKDFDRKVDKWVEELIKKLVTIRKVYK
jgi:uncharacterized membrane protein (Fun14 family)